jgi:hypothetical protein
MKLDGFESSDMRSDEGLWSDYEELKLPQIERMDARSRCKATVFGIAA